MAPVLRTACTRDCPDACSILAHVEDGRVVSLRGDRHHPITRGFLCERTRRYVHRQYDPNRLVHPLRRVDRDTFEPVAWDAALDDIAQRLQRLREESGPECVLHYRSGGSLGILKTVNDWFFECFGGARVKKGDICSGAGEAAQEADMGLSASHAFEDVLHSRGILLWGRNVTTSFVHQIPLLKEARRRGATITLIDPVPGSTARLADHVVSPRPGTDRFLALGMAQVLDRSGAVVSDLGAWSVGAEAFLERAHSRSLEEWAAACDVPVATLEALAQRYAAQRPSCILVGWGLQRRRHGATTVRTIDALAALAGYFGVPGGGVSFTFQRRDAFATARWTAPPERRGISEAMLGAGILAAEDPPVRAVFVDNGNPVAMLPDSHNVARALRSRELVVVLEQFMTDTASCADYVLPVTTMLEEEDILGAFGHQYLNRSRAVIAPPEGVRTDLEIYQALAERLGFEDAMAGTPEAWMRRLLEPVADRVRLEDLAAHAVPNPRSPAVLFEGKRFATADGRFHFVTAIDCTPPARDDAYPLQLGAFSTPVAQSSQWSRDIRGDLLEARCHPRAAPWAQDGDAAVLRSARGALRVRLRFDPAQRDDLVVVPKGGWLMHGHAANALVHAVETDLGGGAAYYDEPVRLEPDGPVAASAGAFPGD